MFLVSWRNAGAEQGTLTWDDYLEQGVLHGDRRGAGDHRRRQGRTRSGSASAARCWPARSRCWPPADEHPAASMTLLTTMLDFTDTGEIGLLVTEEGVAAAGGGDRQGRPAQGQRAGAGVRLAARQRPDLAVRRQGLPARARPPPAFDLLYWNSDDTNLPGPMFCWYVRNTYLENKLREPGATDAVRRAGGPGAASTCRRSSTPRRRTTSCRGRRRTRARSCCRGDVTFVLGASGHIAGVINPPAKNKRNYWIERRAGRRRPGRAGSTARRRSPAAGGRPGTRGWRRTPAPKVERPQEAGQRRVHADRGRPGRLRQAEGALRARAGLRARLEGGPVCSECWPPSS